MANLVITVIAIALVAIASLMGAYYGGSAFMNNQSKAEATVVLNQSGQIALAWKNYESDNFDSPPPSLNSLVTSGNYLSGIPIAPRAPGNIQSFPIFIALSGAHYYAYADAGTPSSAALAGKPADPYATGCFFIQKAAGQQSTSISTIAQGSIAAQGNGTFGCAMLQAALTNGLGGATPPTGDLSAGDYVLEYLLQ